MTKATAQNFQINPAGYASALAAKAAIGEWFASRHGAGCDRLRAFVASATNGRTDVLADVTAKGTVRDMLGALLLMQNRVAAR